MDIGLVLLFERYYVNDSKMSSGYCQKINLRTLQEIRFTDDNKNRGIVFLISILNIQAMKVKL